VRNNLSSVKDASFPETPLRNKRNTLGNESTTGFIACLAECTFRTHNEYWGVPTFFDIYKKNKKSIVALGQFKVVPGFKSR
jgi:hypothetical protein